MPGHFTVCVPLPFRCRAVLDLSNRPHFESDLPLDEEYVGGDAELAWQPDSRGADGAAVVVDGSAPPCDTVVGGVLSNEMLFHVFDSLTLEMRATAHLELRADDGAAGHTLGLALAAASAYGSALSMIKCDLRRS